MQEISRPRVALFVTCLVDLIRPSVGFAAVKLLRDAGCDVHVPVLQTCCGQPAYNAGDRATAQELAVQTIKSFEGYDAVIAPSASCAGMLRVHYPKLFAEDAQKSAQAHEFAGRVHELVSYLAQGRAQTHVQGQFEGRVAYHDSCASLREIPVAVAARKLLRSMPGLDLVELDDREACCGFGGLFSVKYDEISDALVTKKTAAISAAGPDLLLGPDLGCLMNIAGKLSRQGSQIRCRHVAEVLAGDVSAAPIGQAG